MTDGLLDTRLACSRQRVAFTQLILLNEHFVVATYVKTPFLSSHRAVRLMGLLNWPQVQEVAKRIVDLRYPAGGFEPF